MPKDELDAFTAALLNSSYFGGLSEYHVGAPSFQGGFLPDSQCTQKAPSEVGFYAPIDASIIGFLQCELDHGDVPKGSQVVYNIILPSGSRESDFFGIRKLCDGDHSPVAWHFHQTPYSTEAEILLGVGLLAGATGGSAGAADAFLLVLGLLDGGPFYTIESADSRCGNLVHNLAHEMVEAASDPSPPFSVISSGGGGEVTDICDDREARASVPFVPQPGHVLPPNPSFPASGDFTTASTILVPQYWSNASQKCVTGFNDATAPSGLHATITGNGADISLTITGSGFGLLPNPPLFNPPWSINLPYLAIQDETQGWQAGNELNSDFVKLNVQSWSDTSVVIKGLSFRIGNLVMQPNDHLSFWVCNPASAKCEFGQANLIETGLAQLKVLIYNMPNVNLLYNLFANGNKVAGPLANHTDTGWLSFNGSPTVTVTENSTQPGFFTPKFINGCDSNGRVVLRPGDNQTCSILNIAATGCGAGEHCCSNPTSSNGCSAGCVADAIACEPLCGPKTNKCCEGQLPNGRCETACISSPPHSCQ